MRFLGRSDWPHDLCAQLCVQLYCRSVKLHSWCACAVGALQCLPPTEVNAPSYVCVYLFVVRSIRNPHLASSARSHTRTRTHWVFMFALCWHAIEACVWIVVDYAICTHSTNEHDCPSHLCPVRSEIIGIFETFSTDPTMLTYTTTIKKKLS